MQAERKQLISEMTALVTQTSAQVQQLKKLDITQLNHRKGPQSWSALECIEHLNLYGDFYLPEIEKRILAQKPAPSANTFTSGVIGNYFANLMLAPAKPGKMKSPKDKNPAGSELSITTLDRFLKQQDRLLALLSQAQSMDLTRIKCAISISKLIQLRLGDTFRFLIYHIDRHVKQAGRAVGDRS